MEDVDGLRASRARIAAAWVEDRRRTERALHDGVQQDLVALVVGLQLARDLVVRGDTEAPAALDELRSDVHDALERVRRLADDIYPSGLETWGLREALLRSAAHVRIEDVGPLRPELEAAIVVWCRAAIEGPEGASVELRRESDCLRLEIAGGRATDAVRDLVAAAGGTTSVDDTGRVVATFPR